ncbi:hypothetical protein BB561_003729 [Smittium simulii]|uniref:Extracellular membrane protein CFEM domain-containing protein n=1 Tax=Smittium simulii TaxID=133385 RepID=A0A2T9YJS3_9FUNG|nr:hypothetical protein BB561_003729 [Smittium simulii]
MNFKALSIVFGLLAVSVYSETCTDGISKCVKLSGEGQDYRECVGGSFVDKKCNGEEKCFNSGDTSAILVIDD